MEEDDLSLLLLEGEREGEYDFERDLDLELELEGDRDLDFLDFFGDPDSDLDLDLESDDAREFARDGDLGPDLRCPSCFESNGDLTFLSRTDPLDVLLFLPGYRLELEDGECCLDRDLERDFELGVLDLERELDPSLGVLDLDLRGVVPFMLNNSSMLAADCSNNDNNKKESCSAIKTFS